MEDNKERPSLGLTVGAVAIAGLSIAGFGAFGAFGVYVLVLWVAQGSPPIDFESKVMFGNFTLNLLVCAGGLISAVAVVGIIGKLLLAPLFGIDLDARCPNPNCRSKRGWDGSKCAYCGTVKQASN